MGRRLTSDEFGRTRLIVGGEESDAAIRQRQPSFHQCPSYLTLEGHPTPSA